MEEELKNAIDKGIQQLIDEQQDIVSELEKKPEKYIQDQLNNDMKKITEEILWIVNTFLNNFYKDTFLYSIGVK